MLVMVSSYLVRDLGRETLEEHSQLPIKANKCSVGAVVWRHRHVHVIPTQRPTDSDKVHPSQLSCLSSSVGRASV